MALQRGVLVPDHLAVVVIDAMSLSLAVSDERVRGRASLYAVVRCFVPCTFQPSILTNLASARRRLRFVYH